MDKKPAKNASLAAEYLKLVELSASFDHIMGSMIPMMTDLGLGDAPQRVKNAASAMVVEEITKIREDWIAEIAIFIANNVATKDLKAIVDFHKSPAGVAMVSLTPKVNAASKDIIERLWPSVASNLNARIENASKK